MSESTDRAPECGHPKCHEPRWQNTSRCLRHYVLRGLLKFHLVRTFGGHGALRGATAVFAWHKLRECYLGFFSARAKALVEGTAQPLRRPLDAVAIALTIHPPATRGRPFDLKLSMGHWLALVEFTWKFDRRIDRHVIQKKPFRPAFRANLTREGARLKQYRARQVQEPTEA